jgi:hypothetical protein
VTVRFEPNEPGSFTGNVQVGINGGQGSVTSSPLVGVAHKIEVSPAELSFGLVFVDSTREQKLTVKNQGVTSVSLAVSTNEPYSVVSTSSFTLASSQSQDVTVRFTPAGSGVFSSSVRLTAGSNTKEVPVVGRAMTREEYLQQAVAAYNAAVQQGNFGALYVQDAARGLALAGFPSLSADEVNGFMSMFDQLASPQDGELPPEVAQALEILSTIGEQQVEEWLWTLVLAERAGQFETEYERLLMLGFDRVVQALQLVTGRSAIQVKADIYDLVYEFAVTNANSLSEAVQIIFEQPSPDDPTFDIYDKAREVFLAAAQAGEIAKLLEVIGLIPGLQWVWGVIAQYIPDVAAHLLASIFYDRMMTAAASINDPVDRDQFIENIKIIVRHLASRVGEDPGQMALLLGELWLLVEQDLLTPQTTEVRREALALISVAATSIKTYGWDLVNIRRKITGRDGRQYTIDLMLYKVGLEIGEGAVNTLSMINFYGCPGGRCSPELLRTIENRIAGELDAIMSNFTSLLQEYNADFGIVGLVIIDPTTSVGEDGLQSIFNQIELALIANGNPENAAIFMVWTDSTGQLWFACFGQGCNRMTSGQKRREACRLAGKASPCRAREWVVNNEGIPPPPKEGEEPGPGVIFNP